MPQPFLPFIILLALGSNGSRPSAAPDEPAEKGHAVEVVNKPDEKRVDILMDGELFTAYLYPDNLAKPVLHPIRTGSGQTLTRGFPLDPQPGERTDHPHHVGLWFNYGDVNGLDFWNNSEAVPEEKRDRYGSIRHTAVRKAKGGKKAGELEVSTEWRSPAGEVLLDENTRFIFSNEGEARSITRITSLKARDQPVSFRDNKEGVIGIRVARALELPSDEPAVFLDAQGNPTEVKAMSSEEATGHYLSSEGLTGDEVWGTRGRWVLLHGKVDGRPAALALLDHPANVGYPTYWHARGYGLFAANPLGQEVFSEGEERLNFALQPGESVTFRHQLLVYGEEIPEKAGLERHFAAFAKVK